MLKIILKIALKFLTLNVLKNNPVIELMKLFNLFFFFVLGFYFQSSAQELSLTGKVEQGGLLLGKAENAEKVWLNDKMLLLDKSGNFLIGFDRDDTSSYLLKVKYQTGKVQLKKLFPAKRVFKIQKINNMKKELVTAPKSENERIVRERKVINEARSTIGQVDTALYFSGFIRPVSNGRISGVFGSQRILNGVPKNIHNGLDIAAPKGTPVYAMTDGIVRLAADTFYYSGNFIMLDHGQGLSSVYLHLSHKDVKEGDRVKKGDKIGEIGQTGRSTGPHLHWGVQWYDKKIDPQGLLDL